MKLSLALLAISVLAASADAQDIRGTYTVPAGFGLDEPVDVPMTHVRLTIDDDGQARFNYRLPKELDGPTPQRFRLTGTTDGERVSLRDDRGDAVTAECAVTEGVYRCEMTYNRPFVVDREGALRHLEASGASPAEIEKLQRASDSLQHQAAGIVTIPRS